MIQAKNILLVQGIARELQNNNQFITPNVGPIIQGLNAASFFGFQYEEGNIVKTLPLVTRDDTNHTELLEHAAEIIAGNLRKRFENIKKIVVPLVNKISERCFDEVRMTSMVDAMMMRVYLNFNRVDTTTINSPFYPKEEFNKGIDFTKINFSKYVSGTYVSLPEDDIVKLLKTSNEDINTFVADKICAVKNYFQDIFVNKATADMWESDNVLGTAGIDDLFTFWLLLNKLARNEEPIPQVSNVTLDDYHAGINYVLACVQHKLIEQAKLINSYAASGILLRNNKAKINMDYVVPSLSGSVEIWYTDAAVEEVLGKGGTLSEAVYGYLYGSLTNQLETGFSVNKVPEYVEFYHKANKDLSTSQATVNSKKIINIIIDEIEKFGADLPIIDETFEKVMNAPSIPNYKRITYLIGESYFEDYKRQLYNMFNAGKECSPRASLMESQLLLKFMRVIGLGESADLISATSTSINTEEVNIANLRTHNTVAVIDTIVKELLNK